ncbi:MAG: hypothetical protein MI892_02690 [Desulfobacterales bacterium]|nr:hypothetical protein [Desulfobacterales bacterium]
MIPATLKPGQNRTGRSLIIGLIGLLAPFLILSLSGCSGKGQTVQLLPETREPITCEQALTMDTRQIPDDDFYHILDNSQSGDWLDTCWKPLVIKALEESRDIPMTHLSRAIHRFNRRDTIHAFNLAAFQYFSRIAKGEETYGDPQKALLSQYLHLAIREADHKNDANLKKAMLVASRLDPDMYNKFFN